MNAQTIIKQLYRHFDNYEYKLNNTFVFNWESDFFCQSKSGYYVEVEVKISRGDYFVDFKKDKHLLFNDLLQKKTFHIERLGPVRGYGISNDRLIGKGHTYQLVTRFGDKEERRNMPYSVYENRSMKAAGDWHYGNRNGKWGYWVNDFGRIDIHKIPYELWAPASKIKITPIEKMLCPNQFYYAVPEGLIKPEELPPYAGLLYLVQKGEDYYEIKMIKKAPYMHKGPLNLTGILLKKYYNLWVYKVPWETKITIQAK